MCKLYDFPKQMELPKDEKEILNLLGEAYILALYNSLLKLVGDDPDREKMDEINFLVNQAFAEGMNQAIKKKENET